MTVSTTTSLASYTGNGATVAYPVPFRFLDDADLRVSVDGTLLEITTDYSVEGARDESGGTVTMVSAPVNGANVLIERSMDMVQPVDLITGGAFRAQTHEDALDRLTMLIQQVDSGQSQSLRLADSSAGDQYLYGDAATRAGKVVVFDASGNAGLATAADFGAVVVTPFAETVLAGATAAAVRATLGSAGSGANADITSLNPASASGDSRLYKETSDLFFTLAGYGSGIEPVFGLDRANGTKDSPSPVLTGDVLGYSAYCRGYGGTTWTIGGYGYFEAAENYNDTTGNKGTNYWLKLRNIGAGAGLSSFGFMYDGRLVINRTTDDGSGAKLQVNGGINATSIKKNGIEVGTRNVQYGQIVSATGTSTIPNDDTVPTNTEGTQIATLTITPSSASKKVRLSCSLSAYIYAPAASVEVGVILALFRGSTCVATSRVRQQQDSATGNATGEFVMGIETVDSPASATSQTYTLRIGRFGAGTWYANGPVTVDHGGVLDNTYLIAEEID